MDNQKALFDQLLNKIAIQLISNRGFTECAMKLSLPALNILTHNWKLSELSNLTLDEFLQVTLYSDFNLNSVDFSIYKFNETKPMLKFLIHENYYLKLSDDLNKIYKDKIIKARKGFIIIARDTDDLANKMNMIDNGDTKGFFNINSIISKMRSMKCDEPRDSYLEELVLSL